MAPSSSTQVDRPPIAQVDSYDLEWDYRNGYEDVIWRIMPGFEDIYNLALSFLQVRVNHTARLLIVGAGGGKELTYFGKRNPDWDLVGVDPSSQMLAVAKRKVAQEGLTAEYHLGYTKDLPSQPVYDAATSILVMHFLPNEGEKLIFLENICERLKPNSTFILVDIHGDRNSSNYRLFMDSWKLYQQRKGIISEELYDQITQQIELMVYPISEERTVNLLGEAGFTDVHRFYMAYFYGGWIATKK